ncbi:uncharacterized protein LOC120352182 [Nilaparvata lugens]|uniref:uncharacterized protein LOC120352182 n=1 Tax=Nilaparvata lugens TaxID=108931 RepID=UPI00193D41D1|nr:uncharacterized protein LOC120352182 [Nilaparvata lugens]
MEEHLIDLRRRLATAYKDAHKRSTRMAEQRTKIANKGRKLREFVAGDLVYLHDPATKPGDSTKFHLPWKGPFAIAGKLSTVNYLIKLPDGRQMVVHVNRLKLCYKRGEAEADPLENVNEDLQRTLEIEERAKGTPSSHKTPEEEEEVEYRAPDSEDEWWEQVYSPAEIPGEDE